MTEVRFNSKEEVISIARKCGLGFIGATHLYSDFYSLKMYFTTISEAYLEIPLELEFIKIFDEASQNTLITLSLDDYGHKSLEDLFLSHCYSRLILSS